MGRATSVAFSGDQLASPLLGRPRFKDDRSRSQEYLLRCGLRSTQEVWKVITFLIATFLANAVFVIGRNVGPALFLSAVGPAHLTTAIFASGVVTIFAGQLFSTFSRGRSPASVNRFLLAASAVTTGGFFLGIESLRRDPDGDPAGMLAFGMFFALYMAQDVVSMFVAMQCASVAQAAFTVSDAKRLFGLVQLGNSLAAMTVGLGIGSIAELLGTEQLLLVQSVILLLSLAVNAHIEKDYAEPGGGGGRKKKKASADALVCDTDPWWKNWLVLAMGLWSFTVQFTKTMYEYEYNYLIAGTMSAEQMVALTGYLYAGAGLFSTAINVLGTKLCLDRAGMRGAILATPACLLSVSLAILVAPSVRTTFAGRLVDLSLRWSLNNSVRTVLWIAVPAAQAAAAKPWVEGTVKKMGQAFNALVISVALQVSGNNLGVLSFLSLAFSAWLLLCCVRVYRLYLQSMWLRIKRRELKHEFIGQLPNDRHIKRAVMEKLVHGNMVVQLDTLLQLGEGLSDRDWEGFFSGFHEMPAMVQMRVIELSRKQPFRVSNDFLLELVSDNLTEPAVQKMAMMAVGDRRLYEALELLLLHLGSSWPPLRAAAAVTILKIGWGIGLGTTSSAALLVLEDMLSFPLVPLAQQCGGTRSAVLPILASRGRQSDLGEPGLEELSEHVTGLEEDWNAALEAGALGRAVVLATQLSHIKAAWMVQQQQQAACESLDGCSSVPLSPKLRQQAAHEEQRNQELAAALEALRELPEPHALVPFDVWKKLLQHRNDKVKIAALAFAEGSAAKFPDLIERIVLCLQSPDTYTAAEGALQRINRPLRMQEAVLEQLLRNAEQYGLVAAQPGRDRADESLAASSIHMMHLLKFLKNQSSSYADAELPRLQSSNICDTLLRLSSGPLDADVLQELQQTMVDLKDQGFSVTRELAETAVQEVAEKLCKGLAVQRWFQQLCKQLSRRQLGILRRCLELPIDLPDGREAEEEQGVTDRALVEAFERIGLGFLKEQIYAEKLRLLEMSVLAAPRTKASYRSTRVLAAWRLLREKDPSSEAAVLELLDALLPVKLKVIVLPLLDGSPVEKKLSVGASISKELEGARSAVLSTPPPWLDAWLRCSVYAVGAQLADLISHLAPASHMPPPVKTQALLPKMLLLSGVSLYAGVLSIHLAEVAMIASTRHCQQDALLCEEGEAYIVASGTFSAEPTGQVFRRGDAIQELHAICKELPVLEVHCTSPGGGTVLCITRRRLLELQVRLMPKFALSLLKAVVQNLPAPAQIGASRVPEQPLELGRMRLHTGESEAEEDFVLEELAPEAASRAQPEVARSRKSSSDEVALLTQEGDGRGNSEPGEGIGDGEAGLLSLAPHQPSGLSPRASFPLLERLLLLQEVKIFRHVAVEYLASIAKCCAADFEARGGTIIREGDTTNATLYVVADGAIGLYKRAAAGAKGEREDDPGTLLRKLYPGDTMGNTALLCDTHWAYSAQALEDTWLLKLDRRDLTDVLRGRRELASAVIRGLYKTFTRRIQQLERNVIVRKDTAAW